MSHYLHWTNRIHCLVRYLVWSHTACEWRSWTRNYGGRHSSALPPMKFLKNWKVKVFMSLNSCFSGIPKHGIWRKEVQAWTFQTLMRLGITGRSCENAYLGSVDGLWELRVCVPDGLWVMLLWPADHAWRSGAAVQQCRTLHWGRAWPISPLIQWPRDPWGSWALWRWPLQLRNWNLHFIVVNELQLRQPGVARGYHLRGTSTDRLLENSAKWGMMRPCWGRGVAALRNSSWGVTGWVHRGLSPPSS